jgi:hypothetical protein
LENNFFAAADRLVASVRSEGAWFSLEARKIAAPPLELLSAMQSAPKTGDFRTLD